MKQNNVTLPIWESILAFCKHVGMKIGNGLLEFLVIVGTFFAPAGPVLLAVGLSIALDTYFGRWKAKHNGERVTSKKTRLGLVPKSIGYSLMVLAFYTLDYAIVDDFIQLFFPQIKFVTTKLVGLVLIYVEYTSMDESYKEVKGVKLKQAFGNMMKGVRGFIGDILKTKQAAEKLIEKEEDKDGSE